MKNYKLWNNILAWLTFAIAAFTYLSTIEPSVSFWDCGEFIAAADKLLIGHPPGAPLFLMIARVFAMVAPSPDKVALMINAMSALCSAFTILFLFWTISHLAKKLLLPKEQTMTQGSAFAILGSALVGALAYTFTDSFWFSAVEGEVYAMSSLFTAVVFWAILRWEGESSEAHSTRWIILIALLLGLSIGVHLLNLLAIPAIALVIYYKQYKTVSMRGVIYTLLISAGILGIIMYGIIPGTVTFAAYCDLFFVNVLNLPFNSGVLFFFILLLGLIALFIYRTYQKKKVLANTILTFMMLLCIGYSSFALVLIRANVNPTMNQNAPDDAFSLLSYLNREQYGERPLVYGQYFNAPVERYDETGARRDQINGKYQVVGMKYDRVYDDNFKAIFPRMWSNNPNHVAEYKKWVTMTDLDKQKPTYADNIEYLTRFQLGHMYWRYFMWNFVGRQNDQQNHGSVIRGNWISGINVVDKVFIGGDPQLLPDLLRQDKSRNTYYFLPLILGILGITFQIKRRKTGGTASFLVVTTLFILTGIAIVFYLNQHPLQPRERDYAYAASFYAFSIWIGFGVLYLWQLVSHIMKQRHSALVAAIFGLSIPTILSFENWDDHNRSDRYMARDMAYNYLSSCDENGIIFTNGDNDTFPLWYMQEVEGMRTDVRVCNLSYLNTWWYIEQMRKESYESSSVPFSLDKNDTRMAKNNNVYLIDYTHKAVSIPSALAWLKSDNPKTKTLQGKDIPHFPGNKFYLDVDKEKLQEHYSKEEVGNMVDRITLDYSAKKTIQKNNLMVMDMLASNNWERSIYYSVGVPQDLHFGLGKYLETCGVTFKLVPKEANGRINTTQMYDNVMHHFRYGGLNLEDIYLDGDSRKQAQHLRRSFVSLADALYQEGKIEKAREVMKRCMVEIPSRNIPFTYAPPYHNDFPMADTLLKLEMKAEAISVISEIHHNIKQDMDYYLSFDIKQSPEIKAELRNRLSGYYHLSTLYKTHFKEESKDVIKEFENYYALLVTILEG